MVLHQLGLADPPGGPLPPPPFTPALAPEDAEASRAMTCACKPPVPHTGFGAGAVDGTTEAGATEDEAAAEVDAARMADASTGAGDAGATALLLGTEPARELAGARASDGGAGLENLATGCANSQAPDEP